MHRRGGDLVTAISFIKAILAQDPDIKLEWVIKRDISSYQKNLTEFKDKELGAYSQRVNLTVLDSSDYEKVHIDANNDVVDNASNKVLTIDELTERCDRNWGLCPRWFGWQDVHVKLKSMPTVFNPASAIVILANPHRMVKADHDFLHNSYKKPIVIIPEYSLSHVNNRVYHHDDIYLPTGFAEKGVYIDAVVKFEGGFEHVDQDDASFLEHLLQGEIVKKEHYHATTNLFYGYFGDNDDFSHPNYTVKIKSFIQNTIMLAMDRGQKKLIDLVMPGFADPRTLETVYRAALNELPKAYLDKIADAKYTVKNASKNFDEMSIKNGAGDYAIRLINPQRVQRITVQALLNEAEPFMGLTGDASWIEGLMKGKIVCYQALNWKCSSYQGFLTFVRSVLGSESPLRQFYELQGPCSPAVDKRWKEMRTLYTKNKDTMLREAKQLAVQIERHKDLNKTLIPDFLRLINRTVPVPIPIKKTLDSSSKVKDDFNLLLKELERKVTYFSKKGHVNAKNVASSLHTLLKTKSETYFKLSKDDAVKAYPDFKTACIKAINAARPELEKHRGMKAFLGNLVLAVLGLGLFYIIAASINYARTNGKHFFFQFETDTAKKLDNMEMIIDKLELVNKAP